MSSERPPLAAAHCPERNPPDHRSRADHASPLLRRGALGGGAAGAATIVAVVGAEMPTVAVAVADAASARPSGSASSARSSAAESPTHGAGMRATTAAGAARAAKSVVRVRSARTTPIAAPTNPTAAARVSVARTFECTE